MSEHCKRRRRTIGEVAVLTLLALCSMAPAQPDEATTNPAAIGPDIKPRLELHVPSATALIDAVRNCNGEAVLAPLSGLFTEIAESASDGVDVDAVRSLSEMLRGWPDTSLDLYTYAPDTEGRPRWQVRIDWTLSDLFTRAAEILKSEAGQEMFEGLKIEPRAAGGFRLALPDSTLGYLLTTASGGSRFATHDDMELPDQPYRGFSDESAVSSAAVVCRLNLKPTETDSGATFWSSFRVVTDVEYAGGLNDDGEWEEQYRVNWPPISGAAAKALLSRVKQTFYVPGEAFGAMAINSLTVPAMLDSMVGLGPQVIQEAPGEMTIVTEQQAGPLMSHADSEICFAILPGTGFLPVPDFVVQSKVSRPESLLDAVRRTSKEANRLFRDREQTEPWSEIEVRGRPVFWRRATGTYPGAMMPFVLRSVLFVATETDDRGRERDFVVLGWTTTSAERFVERWLDLPRGKDAMRIPQARKTNGELWINWRQLYTWIQPHLNVTLSTIARDTLLPSVDEVQEKLTAGYVQFRTRYTGLEITHRGPVPTGAIAIPVMTATSLEADRSGGSDLARERLGAERLRVLYHHCKLFREDVGRWPAEVAELDGYVDFGSHPYLLHLRLSAQHRRSEWWESMFEGVFDADEDYEDVESDMDEDGDESGIDDSLYKIKWGRERWSLGFAPDTFEHLDQLFIDQDGEIHRVPKRVTEEAEQQGTNSE